MPLPSPQSPSRRAKDNERPLVEDIRLIGRILGDVIREQEGVEAYELVEQVRKLSVAFRRDADHEADRDPVGDGGPAREREVALEDRPLGVADDRVEVVPGPERVVAQPIDERTRVAERVPVGVLRPEEGAELHASDSIATPANEERRPDLPGSGAAELQYVE